MNVLEIIQYKLIQFLAKILGFTFNIDEKNKDLKLNVKILNERGRKNFIKVVEKLSDKINKIKGE